MSITLYDVCEFAREDLSKELKYGTYSDEYEVRETIEQIAEQSVPVFWHQIIDLACEKFDLVRTIPEPLIPSREESPLDLICRNIKEHIRDELMRWYYSNQVIES